MLVFRRHLGVHLVDADLPGDGIGGHGIVARQHDDFEAGPVQQLNGFRRGRLDRVGDAEQTGSLAVDAHEHDGLPLLA